MCEIMSSVYISSWFGSCIAQKGRMQKQSNGLGEFTFPLLQKNINVKTDYGHTLLCSYCMITLPFPTNLEWAGAAC